MSYKKVCYADIPAVDTFLLVFNGIQQCCRSSAKNGDTTIVNRHKSGYEKLYFSQWLYTFEAIYLM